MTVIISSQDNKTMDLLYQSFPCREKQIDQLNDLYGYIKEPLPAVVFIYGQSAVGKTTLLLEYFKAASAKYAYINCIECYTQRLLLESIVLQLLGGHENIRCDNFMDLVQQLKVAQNMRYFDFTPHVIILDGVEYLESVNEQYLSVFASLQEITNIYSMGVIFVSNIIPEKFHTDSSFISIHFPQYTKDELLKILKLNKPLNCTDKLFENYLNIAVSVFLRTTRDLNEIKSLIYSNFDKYCEPVLKGEIKDDNIALLWNHIAPHFKTSLNSVYLGLSLQQNTDIDQCNSNRNVELITHKTLPTFDLPYYAKYLLIAAYLASYNSSKHDRRLYLKNHGKQKKKASKKIMKDNLASGLLGPKAFSLDRLLAIFYAIMEEKASLTVNLMSQIASLVELRLLAKIGDGSIDRPKYKCLVSFQCVELVAKTLSFHIRKYLMD